MMRKTGIGLLVAAYVLVLYTSLAAPAYAHAHQQLGAAMLAAYAAPWPVALACALALNGLALALIPIRRGERWAIWLSAVTLLILLTTRSASDPRCLVVLDPHQHGCHTFMVTMFLGLAGLALAVPRQSKPGQSGVGVQNNG
jgi:nicotinamide riboside transporter PnuC